MITLENVTKRFGEATAVDHLSFEVAEGEFCILIGPSGCGKSTTLRLINRLIPLSSGRISIEGEDISSYRPEALRRRIGYAIQNVGLFPHMTVAQNIAVVPKLLQWDRERISRRTGELLELLNLSPATYRGKFPRQLSGGEAQRIGVARALAADPQILLMDEPFGAIDPITRESLQSEFGRIQRELKKTIIFVTHDIDEAIRLGSRIVILRNGRLVQNDTPERIMSAPAGKFVTEFIGADRALKRLARIPVSDHMTEAPSVSIEASPKQAAGRMGSGGYVWVVDGEGKVLGWVSERDLEVSDESLSRSLTSMDYRTSAVRTYSTLKEALSRMIQQGILSAPVVDAEGILLGEIRLTMVLEA